MQLARRARTTLYYISYGIVIGVFAAIGTSIVAAQINQSDKEWHNAVQ